MDRLQHVDHLCCRSYCSSSVLAVLKTTTGVEIMRMAHMQLGMVGSSDIVIRLYQAAMDRHHGQS